VIHEPTIGRLQIVPCSIGDAKAYVLQRHRHHPPPVSGLFAVAAATDAVVGVAIVGRPTARRLQDGFTAEVTRLCTDGTQNACSMLYRASWRAARALGYRRLVTFTLAKEPGTSLIAAGFKEVGRTPGRSWSVPSRPRVDRHPLQERIRWELSA
jgi:L-amino acid N-acyltransferase YncA